jgi:hypothetical protein
LLPVRLRASTKQPAHIRSLLAGTLRLLPELTGEPITIVFRPDLTVYRGRLKSGAAQRGTPVHAAAYIRARRLVLETALMRQPGKLRWILAHELFHFVWTRLGNVAREEYRSMLLSERKAGARGELGESAAFRKQRLPEGRNGVVATEAWRDYVCESFCDTAAWLYAGRCDSAAGTLAKRWRSERRRWFLVTFAAARKC